MITAEGSRGARHSVGSRVSGPHDYSAVALCANNTQEAVVEISMSESVSIVTSVLNGAQTLQRCLRSVAQQTVPCEHIVVDAGSIDGSLEIAESFAPNGVRLIEAPGTGISEAFNIGIEQARGEFVAILNADDWYEPDTVERSLKALAENHAAGFTYGSALIHRGNRRILATPVPQHKLRWAAARCLPFCHVTSFVRREVYQIHGPYDPRYRVSMDFDFCARIIARGVQGVHIGGILAHIQDGGKSTNRRIRLPEYLRISSQYLGWLPALASLTLLTARGFLFDVASRSSLSQRLLAHLNVPTRFSELP